MKGGFNWKQKRSSTVLEEEESLKDNTIAGELFNAADEKKICQMFGNNTEILRHMRSKILELSKSPYLQ